MVIHSERIDDVVVLRPEERLDASTAPVLEEVVDKVLDGVVSKVLIDLQGVAYATSIGISACLQAARTARERGALVVFSGLEGMAREVFDIAGLLDVLEIHPTREAALASFGWMVPRPASGTAALSGDLTLPEEILLLALDDETGRFLDLPEYALDHALAAAVLMELGRRVRIDSDLERVLVVDPTPVRDPVLDPALAALAHAGSERSADDWIGRLAREGESLRDRVVDRLVHRGILARKDRLLHWMLGGRRYPVVDDQERREVRERVLAVLRNGEIPGPHDVAIIALADACAVFDALLDMDEMMELGPHIQEVAAMDLLAQAMTRALERAQAAGPGAAAIASPVASIYGRTSDAAS